MLGAGARLPLIDLNHRMSTIDTVKNAGPLCHKHITDSELQTSCSAALICGALTALSRDHSL